MVTLSRSDGDNTHQKVPTPQAAPRRFLRRGRSLGGKQNGKDETLEVVFIVSCYKYSIDIARLRFFWRVLLHPGIL